MEEIITLSFHAPSGAFAGGCQGVLYLFAVISVPETRLWSGKMREKENKAEARGFSPSYGSDP